MDIPSFLLSMGVFVGGRAIVELHCERLMDLTSRPNQRRPVRFKTATSYVEHLPHKTSHCRSGMQAVCPKGTSTSNGIDIVQTAYSS